MSTIKLYTTAIHKQKENCGYYNISIWKNKAKSPVEINGVFDSKGRPETQIRTLITAIITVDQQESPEEMEIYCDLPMVEGIIDGSIETWQENKWYKSKGNKMPNAVLWQELYELLESMNLTFHMVDTSDSKLASALKSIENHTKVALKPLKISAVKEKTAKESNKGKKEAKKSPSKTQTTSVKTAMKPTVKNASDTVKPSTQKETGATTEQVNLDSALKKQSDDLFQALGMDTETAVTMFLKHALRNQGIALDLNL